MKKQTLLLTGCAGFIGCNFLKKIACRPEVKSTYDFLVVDALTYAGHFPSIARDFEENDHLHFLQVDLRRADEVKKIFQMRPIAGVIHFAAESHVDRSILNPNIFVETNVLGTLNLLQNSLEAYRQCEDFCFLQVSTDEVYGTLRENDLAFSETTPLSPNSPYSASKAAADLLVRSYYETYGLPTIITRCSNNYGPYQFPEKFIPLMILCAKQGRPLPIYGKGLNIRDWIYVDDHNEGVWLAFTKGRPGEVYNFGGGAEMRNIDVALKIVDHFDGDPSWLSFVTDRLGHDYRYAINFAKAELELGWHPQMKFSEGLEFTMNWYQQNTAWINDVKHRQERKDAPASFQRLI